MKTYFIKFNNLNLLDAEGLIETLEPLQELWNGAILLNKSEQEPGNENWNVEFITEDRPDEKMINQSLKTYFKTKKLGIIHNYSQIYNIEVVENIDWLAQNRATFSPLRIGRFYIEPLDGMGSSLSRLKAWKIKASLAFGTGNHATTHLCLLALEKLKKQKFSPINSLDVGCGTGILSMACHDLWKNVIKYCKAGDVDKDASKIANDNIINNKMSRKINVFTGAGIPIYKIGHHEVFDLIIMNILAAPLIELAPIIAKKCHKEGYVILSGITKTQRKRVTMAYINQGFRLCNYSIKNDWVQLTLKRDIVPKSKALIFSKQRNILPWEL